MPTKSVLAEIWTVYSIRIRNWLDYYFLHPYFKVHELSYYQRLTQVRENNNK